MIAAKDKEEKTLAHPRIYKYDTMRFLLISSVIVGHAMELFLSGKVQFLYKFIYSFHMPAFLFITGKFARFDRGKILKRFVAPYFVFQTLCLCFHAKIMDGTAVTLQYTTPYWALWYLLAVIAYYLLLPMLPEKGSAFSLAILALSILPALFVGYDNSVGYYMSLSRIVVFAPFFLWGYYQDSILETLGGSCRTPNVRVTIQILSAVIIFCGEYYIFKAAVPMAVLYSSYSYEACGSTITARLVAMVTAAGWILLMNSIVPNRKIPFVSALGRDTMPAYLLHMFVIRLAQKYALFHYSQKRNLLLACGLTLLIIVVSDRLWFYVKQLFF